MIQYVGAPSISLQDIWKVNPAATGARWSKGQWYRHPHLDLISDAISAIASGPIRLIVSLPPRHGKSSLISQWTPIWFLSNWPDKHIILTSYAADFAATWGRRTKNIILDQGHNLGIQLSDDKTAVSDWELVSGGGMMTAGVGGPITGRGADLLIIDDPIKNHQEASSPVFREHLWEWYRTTARTRLEPDGSIIVVATRWHTDDLIGRLLATSPNDDDHDY